MMIEIISAVYGTKSAGHDVTVIVANMANNGAVKVSVNNNTMGGDPDVGVQKKFGLLYMLEDGSIQAKACLEGETINF